MLRAAGVAPGARGEQLTVAEFAASRGPPGRGSAVHGEIGFQIVTTVTVRVPAKINLQLAVGPLRPDGYHDLVTVFHAISLYDEVSVSRAERGQRDGQR